MSMEALGEMAGLPDRYANKLLAPTPIKNLGPMSLSVILSALALKIVRIEIVEDEDAAAKLAGRLVPRKRRTGRKPAQPWCVDRPAQTEFPFVDTIEEPKCSSKTR